MSEIENAQPQIIIEASEDSVPVDGVQLVKREFVYDDQPSVDVIILRGTEREFVCNMPYDMVQDLIVELGELIEQ